ncbi:MAG: hypothetical protein JKY56_26130 [Kofleriaceae bacterium]|nr:hypothetical protein [Kofleriaceae bacterium]
MDEPRVRQRWTLGTGDLDAALRRVGDAGAGALLTIVVQHSSLVSLRSEGLQRDDEGDRLLLAWQTIVKLLPKHTVGLRDGWGRFNFVLEASEEFCIELGKEVIASLLEQTSWRWHDEHDWRESQRYPTVRFIAY